jgi:hypothetical protein
MTVLELEAGDAAFYFTGRRHPRYNATPPIRC